ncbi:MAG: flagellar protein FlgN [Anaerolineales bacterium]
MNDIYTHVNTLEDLLVQEFRTCQTIHQLTKDERVAISKNDINSLTSIVEQKEVMLDELGQIEDRRRMVVQNLGNEIGLPNPSPSILDISKHLANDIGNRLNRLREGISALADEIKILSNGNRSLAMIALERIDALQSLILDTIQPALVYDYPGSPSKSNKDAVWDIDHRV